MSRFKDFTKHLRRVECHYDRTARCGDDNTSPADIDFEAEDPAKVAEENESLTRLHQSLMSLDGESGRLWKLLASGSNLRQIAAELEVSYDSVKRRRRKLIDQLKDRLNSPTPARLAIPSDATGGRSPANLARWKNSVAGVLALNVTHALSRQFLLAREALQLFTLGSLFGAGDCSG